METIIISAFCGTGKSYLSTNHSDECAEVECWNYRKESDFPHNYIKAVLEKVGKVKYLLISTDPNILKELIKQVDQITLIYPDNSLKEEYMKRYCQRKSPYDFIGVLYMHWDEWLNDLKQQDYCKHIVLNSGQYLSDVIFVS